MTFNTSVISLIYILLLCILPNSQHLVGKKSAGKRGLKWEKNSLSEKVKEGKKEKKWEGVGGYLLIKMKLIFYFFFSILYLQLLNRFYTYNDYIIILQPEFEVKI